MKYFITLLSLVFSQTLSSQNLLYNGGFENFEKCPKDCSLSKKESYYFEENGLGWKSAGHTNPDYFNSCSKGKSGVPLNWATNLDAHSGNGYIGLILTKCLPEHNICSGSGEVVRTEWATSLKKGKKYRVSFWIAHALYSDYVALNIQVLFLPKYKPEKRLYCGYTADPQVIISLDNVSREWTHVSATYVATGKEKCMMIGDFDGEHFQYFKYVGCEQSPVAPDSFHGSYYLIDDVSLEPVDDNGEQNDYVRPK